MLGSRVYVGTWGKYNDGNLDGALSLYLYDKSEYENIHSLNLNLYIIW